MLLDLFQLIDVLPDDQDIVPAMLLQNGFDHPDLFRVLARQPVFLPVISQAVFQTQLFGHIHADFDAFRIGDPRFLLQVLPRNVHLLGTDQREDILLQAVLPHQCGGETQSAFGLQFRSHAEHGGG